MPSYSQPHLGTRYATGEPQQHQNGRSHLVRDFLANRYHEIGDTVTNHPAATSFVLFGVGIGLGLALGEVLRPPRQIVDRRLARRRAEELGRHVLEAIEDRLPAGWAPHLR